MRRAPKPYLFVSIHDRSWGRSAIALTIARRLVRAGQPVHFVVHARNEALIRGSGFEYTLVSHQMRSMAAFRIQARIQELEPKMLLLSDYFSYSNFLHRIGVRDDPIDFDGAVVSLDVWDFERTGSRIDVPAGPARHLCIANLDSCLDRFQDHISRVVPVPVGGLSGTTPRVDCMPTPDRPKSRRWRRALGLTRSARVVLTATAEYQHPRAQDSDWMRYVSTAVPIRIAAGLERLGPDVHWIHVGPEPHALDGRMAGRCHFRKPLPPRELDALLAEADVYLSANAAATTIARAVALRTPVVVVENSVFFDSPAEGGDFRVYPFRIWPLGYHDFIGRLLDGNAYRDAVVTVQISDEPGFVDTMNRVLRSSVERDELMGRQQAYEAKVRALPDPADLLTDLASERRVSGTAARAPVGAIASAEERS